MTIIDDCVSMQVMYTAVVISTYRVPSVCVSVCFSVYAETCWS